MSRIRNEEQIREWISLHEQGLSYAEIAKLYDVKYPSTVIRVCDNYKKNKSNAFYNGKKIVLYTRLGKFYKAFDNTKQMREYFENEKNVCTYVSRAFKENSDTITLEGRHYYVLFIDHDKEIPNRYES